MANIYHVRLYEVLLNNNLAVSEIYSMKIVVVGLGYVGLSNAVLLAQHNEVIGFDISQERLDVVNSGKSPIVDAELSEYLENKELNLSTSSDLYASIPGADYVCATPTNYDEETIFDPHR